LDNVKDPGKYVDGYSCLIWFMETLFHIIHEKNTKKKNTEALFYCILRFSQQGIEEIEYLLDHGIIKTLSHFFLGIEEFANTDPNSAFMTRPPQTHKTLVDVLVHILCAGKTDSDEKPPTCTVPIPIELKESDLLHVFGEKRLITKLVRQDVSPQSMKKLAEHQCYNSENGTQTWFSIILDGCSNAVKPESVRPFLNLLMWIVNMTDGLSSTVTTTQTTTNSTTQNADITEYRAQLGVDIFMKVFGKFYKNTDFTSRFIAVNDKLTNNNQKWKKTYCKTQKKQLRLIHNNQKMINSAGF